MRSHTTRELQEHDYLHHIEMTGPEPRIRPSIVFRRATKAQRRFPDLLSEMSDLRGKAGAVVVVETLLLCVPAMHRVRYPWKTRTRKKLGFIIANEEDAADWSLWVLIFICWLLHINKCRSGATTWRLACWYCRVLLEGSRRSPSRGKGNDFCANKFVLRGNL